MSEPRHLLLVVGSLRSGSLNRRLGGLIAEAFDRRAEPWQPTWADIGSLPHYDGDLDGAPRPQVVSEFDEQVSTADLSVWLTPIYNAGVSGVLKNALDWASRPAFAGSLAGGATAVAAATTGGHPPDDVLDSLALSLALCASSVAPVRLGIVHADELLTDPVADELIGRVDLWVDAVAEWFETEHGGTAEHRDVARPDDVEEAT